MTRQVLSSLLAIVAVLGLHPALYAQVPDSILQDEALLKEAGLSTDGPGLVEFFRARGLTEVPKDKIATLIKQFDFKLLADREKACAELIAIGPPAVPLLRLAAKDIDAYDSSTLANRCLKSIEDSGRLTAAAARVLAYRRPAGAAETLITFLPYAENENVLEEVKTTLMTVSHREGKPDAALIKALTDEQPLRRAMAIEVLCHAGTAEPRAALRKLLNDPVSIVRFQAGLALSQANDAEAVSTMIDVFADLPGPMAQQVEDYLYGLAGEQGPKPLTSKDAAERTKQRDAWKKWWEANDGTQALAEFRKRTLTDTERTKALRVIDRLGDDDFETRQKASDQVLTTGASIMPLLRANLKNPDLEIRRRVRESLEAIQDNKSTPLPLTAPRMLAVRKPSGAAEAMIAYLPGEDDSSIIEIQTSLNALAYIDGKPDPALIKSLGDNITARRAAAAVALTSQAPPSDLVPQLRRMLKDPEPIVRMQVALGLADAHERDAVPVLIALLGELTEEQSEPAEDYLRRLAGEQAPEMPTGDGDLRPKRAEAWQTWWKANGDRVEMITRARTPLAERFLNYTVLVQPNNGMVSELGTDGKVRWEIKGLGNPWDAQVLPGDRVLITEFNARLVTERNLKGEILWKHQTPNWPISAQRLPNGHTFIAARNQLVEIDRTGREVFNYNRQLNDIMTAAKLRDGQVVVLTNQGTCFRVGPDGKEHKAFNGVQVAAWGNEVLPNGNLLVPVSWQNKVMEYDADGKVVWAANVMQPISASRLPNGNTLISSQQWPAKIIELDKKGNQVGETTLQTYVQRARKR